MKKVGWPCVPNSTYIHLFVYDMSINSRSYNFDFYGIHYTYDQGGLCAHKARGQAGMCRLGSITPQYFQNREKVDQKAAMLQKKSIVCDLFCFNDNSWSIGQKAPPPPTEDIWTHYWEQGFHQGHIYVHEGASTGVDFGFQILLKKGSCWVCCFYS